MRADKIRARIDELCTLFGFTYHGKDGHVDPYSHSEYLLFFDGREQVVHSIDEVMSTPFFDGHNLAEIADQITITEW
jgi:hypothetical protein